MDGMKKDHPASKKGRTREGERKRMAAFYLISNPLLGSKGYSVTLRRHFSK